MGLIIGIIVVGLIAIWFLAEVTIDRGPPWGF